MKAKVWTGILITLIMAVGLYLRFLYLDTPLWYDEACSWVTAAKSFPFGITDNLLHDDLQHTPLYFFILHFWIKLFSHGETAMRGLSLIFGFGALPLVYLISNKIFDKKIAMFSTAICAVSPLLVLFSVEVRMYPVVLFMVLLSFNFLIDFEKKGKTNSLIKMTITNILIPYTFVGGIFYNFSLLISYLIYSYKYKKENFKRFVIAETAEWLCLIPYFILIGYYTKIRSHFIVTHEGAMKFSNIIDIIRNFFGATISPNVYWPSDGNYYITFLFTLLVIIPCAYFIYGYIKTLKISDNFIKTTGKIFCLCFGLAIIFALFEVNVLTVRYILYILPVIIILATAGIIKNTKNIHANIFLSFFITACLIFSFINANTIKTDKEKAFKSPAVEFKKLGIDYRDVVIMPFGSDAPYYFNTATAPYIFNADFHKIVRNPDGIYYDKEQKRELENHRYKFILGKINENNVFSQNFLNYFNENVISKVEKNRYAVLVMYGDDNNTVRPVEELRTRIKNEHDVKSQMLYTMLAKYMCDIVAMLNNNFSFINAFQKDNFTYYIYQKLSE